MIGRRPLILDRLDMAVLLDLHASHAGLSIEQVEHRLAGLRPSANGRWHGWRDNARWHGRLQAVLCAAVRERRSWVVRPLLRLEGVGLVAAADGLWYPTQEGTELAVRRTDLAMLRLPLPR